MSKQYLGIIVALDYELSKLEFAYQAVKKNNQTYYVINDEFILMYSKIGKVNAGYKTALMLNEFPMAGIINIGMAGSCNQDLVIGTFNLVNKLQYGDVDVTCDPQYSINQIPYENKFFYCDQELVDKLSGILNKLNLNYVQGTNLTIDSFVTNSNQSHFYELDLSDSYTIDMEATAIAQVCQHHDVPFASLKVVSDNINVNNNHEEFIGNIRTCQTKINNVINALVGNK